MSVTIDGSAGVTTTTGAVYNSIQSKTAISASGTSVDFTGIPSWVKRITVMFSGVSTSGTSPVTVQLGTGSTSYTTSGYTGCNGLIQAAAAQSSVLSEGFKFYFASGDTAALVRSGVLTVSNLTGNTWTASGNIGAAGQSISSVGGYVALGSALTAIRITTVNGTDTFDAGSINILYE